VSLNASRPNTNRMSNALKFGAMGWTAAWLAGYAIGSGSTPAPESPGMPFRQAGTFTLTPETTNATFTVAVIDLITVNGEFKKAGGMLVLGSDGRPNRVEVNLDSESADAGSEWLNEILLGPRFFNAKQFPQVAFRSASFTAEGDKLNAVEGELTMRGIAKPVTLKVNSFDCRKAVVDTADQRARCTGEASASVKRTDFGMSSWMNSVAESIKIDIRFTAFAQQ